MDIRCNTCNYTGKSKVRLARKPLLLVPLSLVLFILVVNAPVIGVLVSLAAYYFLRRHTCPECKSNNVTVETTPNDQKTLPVLELTTPTEKGVSPDIEDTSADRAPKENPQERDAHAHRKGDIISDFEKYAELTRGRDWRGICTLNQITFDSFGTKKELGALHQHLEKDEVVFAITSGMMQQTVTSNSLDFGANTWLVVLTNERFLFLDSAMLTSSIDKQSIRFDKVQAVSSSQGLVLGKIIVDIGNRMVVIDNCQKATVAIISDLANKWLRELQRRGSMPTLAPVHQQPSERPVEALKGLAELFAAGALTEEEFKAAKVKLLAQL